MSRFLAALATYLDCVSLALAAGADHVREGDVRFKVTCGFDHAAHDDPIVHPDQPGASHLHDFTGAVGIDAHTTTYRQLLALATTCNDAADHAGYWTPALYVDGVKVDPVRMTAYYRRGEKHGDIEPYPPGLKIVSDAGSWQCDEPQFAGATTPDGCAVDVTARVDFPNCWDGQHRDSPDHRSHMAFSTPQDGVNVCPASHPVQVPRLSTYTHYGDHDGRVTLSSGPAFTLHGDFFNGWERARLRELVQSCLNELARCDSGGADL